MLKQFHFGDLLRYVLSGAMLIAAFTVSRYGFPGFSTLLSTSDRAIMVSFAAILSGVLIYALHRAFYRVISRVTIAYLRARGLLDNSFACWRGFHASEFRSDYARWTRRHNYPRFHESLALWASHVHFLYCSAWGLLIGACLGRLLLIHESKPALPSFLSPSPELPYFRFALVVAMVCVAFAFIQDLSLTYTDRMMVKNCHFDAGKPNLAKHLFPPTPPNEDQTPA